MINCGIIVRDTYRPFNVPVYMVLGDKDCGVPHDPRVGIREFRWATGTKGFEMPSSTYFFGGGPVGFWSVDTNELLAGTGNYQTEWISKSIPATNTVWRVAFGHHGQSDTTTLKAFFDDNICGVFDLYLSADDGKLQWFESCGTGWLTSGGGKDVNPQTQHTSSLFSEADEGYVWLQATEEQIEVAFYDGYGKLLFQQARNKEGPMGQK